MTRAFFATFAATVLALSATVVGINIAVDPHGEFGTGWIEPIVENELPKKLSNYDGTHTLLFGSSRMATLPPAAFENDTFNAAMLASPVAADVAWLEWAIDEGLAPQRIIVGMDLVRVQESYVLKQNLLENPRLGPYAGVEPESLRQRLVGTYAFGYVKDSWRAVELEWQGRPDAKNDFQPDGRMARPAEEAALAANPEEPFGPYPNFDVPAWTSWMANAQIAPRHLGDLDRLISIAKAHEIDVVIVSTPWNPQLLDAADLTTHDALMRELFARCAPGVAVVDFTDPRDFGGRYEEFWDQHHFLGPTATKMARALESANHCG